MGGTTSINGCQFVKGSKEDFDNWAALGNTGWDYDSFLPYYQKSENYVGDVLPGSGTSISYIEYIYTYKYYTYIEINIT